MSIYDDDVRWQYKEAKYKYEKGHGYKLDDICDDDTVTTKTTNETITTHSSKENDIVTTRKTIVVDTNVNTRTTKNIVYVHHEIDELCDGPCRRRRRPVASVFSDIGATIGTFMRYDNLAGLMCEVDDFLTNQFFHPHM